jgi:hypothetical protein
VTRNGCGRASPIVSSQGSPTRSPWRRAKVSVVMTASGATSSAEELLRRGLPCAIGELDEPVVAESRGRAGCRRRARAPPPYARGRDGEHVALDDRADLAVLAQPSEVRTSRVSSTPAPGPRSPATRARHRVERRGEAADRAGVGQPHREHHRHAERDAERPSAAVRSRSCRQPAQDERAKEPHGTSRNAARPGARRPCAAPGRRAGGRRGGRPPRRRARAWRAGW